MRYFWLTLAGVLAAGSAVRAQVPQTPPSAPIPPSATTLDPAHNRLDYLLVRWQNEMSRVRSLSAQVARTTKDKTFGDVVTMEGSARYLKPDMASLRLDNPRRPGTFEQYVWSGNYLYEYRPTDKLVRVHPLPPRPQGQVADDSFLSFIFGMKAEDIKRRYDMRLDKEDPAWIYIQIYPRMAADKADFRRAQLVLNAKTMMPRRLWFEQPNQNEITWQLPNVSIGAAMDRTQFLNPSLPPGWRKEIAPKMTVDNPQRDVSPRVIRPQQK